MDRGELARRVFEAGVVGAGGAGFPTHVKLAAEGIDTYLINGAECEPLLTVDQHLMEAEAPRLVQAAAAKVRQALMGGFASSRILEVHGERMIKRTFNPGFKIALHQKDLNLALQSAKALALNLPNTATCQELFNSCAAHGGTAWDHSGMVKALELMANFEIGQKA